MRRSLAAGFGTALLLCAAFAVSCSDSNDDPTGKACGVIVHDCNAISSMSECFDQVDTLYGDCILCIASSGCNYYLDCQRNVPDCILPAALEPPGK
jgi:hypothetical protein